MRLSSQEIKAIKETVDSYDKNARIYLFGSRVDDRKRGGDIDLLIISYNLNENDGYEIKHDLWERIGEQQIDIIIARNDAEPFTRIALREGVLL